MNAARTDYDEPPVQGFETAPAPAGLSHSASATHATASPASFPELTRDEVFRIETPRLWLRWPQLSDAHDIVSFAGLTEVASMTASWPVGVSLDEVRKRISDARTWNARGARLILALESKSAPGKVIGQIGLDVEDDGKLSLGYHLAPAFWGKGLMPEAVHNLVKQAFWLTAATAIEAEILVKNPASRRVLEKAGFISVDQTTGKCGLRGVVEKERFRLERSGQTLLRVV